MTCNPVFVVRIDALPLGGASAEILTWKASDRPYATSAAYEGLILGGLVEIGDLTQAMSDRSGSPSSTGFSCTWFDKDNDWRTMLATPDRAYLTGQEITLLFAADAWLRDEDVPMFPLFRGQLLDPSPRPRKLFSFSGESRLGSRKGPYDMDSPVNKVTAQRAVEDGFPAVPRESIEKRLPALWGEKTDTGITNEFDALVESGMCPAVNLGPLPGTEAQFLPKPMWGTPIKYLDGDAVTLETSLGSRTYTYIFGARTTDGQWSLSDPLTLTGMPAPDGFADDGSGGHRGFGTGVALFVIPYADPEDLAAVTHPTSGNYMGNLWVKDGDESSPSRYYHMDLAGDAFTIGYHDNGDDSHYKSYGPALPQRPLAQINPEAGDFWCFLRHPGTITKLFGSDLGGGLEVQENADSLSPGAEAAYTQIGAETPGVDLGDGTGVEVMANGHYYFGVVLSGAIGLAAKDSGFPPRANLCGWRGDNDLLINQAALIAQDIIVQMTGGPHGRGSEDGTRLQIPSFSSWPVVPIVQTSRFLAVQQTTAEFLGTDLGYVGVVYFGPDDAISWRDHWQQVWIDWGFDRYENEHGQDAISVMDDTLSPDVGVLLREYIELAGGGVEDAGAVRSNEIQNIERYQIGWHPIENVYRSGALETRDAVSVGQYGERWRGSPDTITSHRYTDDPATALDAAARYIADRAIGPSYPAVVGRLERMIPIALGTQIRIQHSDLISSAPIPVYLRERIISPRRGTITLRGRSRPPGSLARGVAPNDAPPYEDATAEEQATLFYISDEAGLLPDGTPGSRLR